MCYSCDMLTAQDVYDSLDKGGKGLFREERRWLVSKAIVAASEGRRVAFYSTTHSYAAGLTLMAKRGAKLWGVDPFLFRALESPVSAWRKKKLKKKYLLFEDPWVKVAAKRARALARKHRKSQTVTEKQLRHLYEVRGFSRVMMARHLGVSVKRVRILMKRRGVPFRTRGEGRRLATKSGRVRGQFEKGLPVYDAKERKLMFTGTKEEYAWRKRKKKERAEKALRERRATG